MSEGGDVSEVGEVFGRSVHRRVSVELCENGYVVKYQAVSYQKTTERRRVFITNSDMLEFIEGYFSGEPKP